MKKAFENIGQAVLFPLKLILALVSTILRIFGIGSVGDGGTVMPKAPKSDAVDKSGAAASAKSGLSPEQKLAMCPIATILAYAAAPKEKRGEVDLSEVPPIQQAWLKAADEKTLKQLTSMNRREALDFVLTQTTSVKSQMMKRPPRKNRTPSNTDGRANSPSPEPAMAMAM